MTVKPNFTTCSFEELTQYHQISNLVQEGAYDSERIEVSGQKWMCYAFGESSNRLFVADEWIPFQSIGGFYTPFGNLPCRFSEDGFPYTPLDRANAKIQLDRRSWSYYPILGVCAGLHGLVKSVKMLFLQVILNQNSILECREANNNEEHFRVFKYTWHTQAQLTRLQRGV